MDTLSYESEVVYIGKHDIVSTDICFCKFRLGDQNEPIYFDDGSGSTGYKRSWGFKLGRSWDSGFTDEHFQTNRYFGNYIRLVNGSGYGEYMVPWGGLFSTRGPEPIDFGYREVPKSLHFKSSVSTVGWKRRENVSMAQLVEFSKRKQLRRPKEPHFYPLQIKDPRKPVLKVYSIDDYGEFHPKFNASQKQLAKAKQKFYARRAKVVQHINYIRNVVYTAKLKRYAEKVANISKRRAEHREIFERRLAKYAARMEKYEAWCKKQKLKGTKILTFRPMKANMPDHPFTEFTVAREEKYGGYFYRDVQVQDGYYETDVYMQDVALFWRLNSYRESYVKPLVSKAAKELAANAWNAIPDLESKVIRKIYDKINRNQVHVGNILAERAQTYEMVLTAYKVLYEALTLKKSFLRKAKALFTNPLRAAKLSADQILQFKFGVEPLAQDLAQALFLLANGKGSDPEITCRANSKTHVDCLNLGGCVFTGMIEISMVVKARIDNDLVVNLSNLGLIDPSQILWEVTPWSFVVDWFIPVGDFIQSLTTNVGLTFRTGTKKIRLRGRFDYSCEARSVNQSVYDDLVVDTQIASGLGGIWNGELKDRSVLLDWPDKSKILRFKNPFSFWHMTESIALLIQKVKLWR